MNSLRIGSLLAITTLSASLNAAEHIDENTFNCITEMTAVRGFYVDNLEGNLNATLAVARSDTGGRYPVGSVVQLIPTEAMVKREAGFNIATNDWEFFEFEIAEDGATSIRGRGTTDVINRFNGNCLTCHSAAHSEWDMICEQNHGCAPVPLTREMVLDLQLADPRCKEPASSQ